MRPVLVIALTAILSAGVSTTVVLLAEPGTSDAASAARVTQVQDRAVAQQLRILRIETRSNGDRLRAIYGAVLDHEVDLKVWGALSDIRLAIGGIDAYGSSVNGRLRDIEYYTCAAVATGCTR